MRRAPRPTLLRQQLPRRWCWALHERPSCSSMDTSLSSTRQRAEVGKEWNLDFSHLPPLGQHGVPLDDEAPHSCCTAALAAAATAQSIERLALTVSSPAIGRALAQTLHTAIPIALRALDLTLHDAAFLRDESSLSTLFRAAARCSARLESLRVAFVACGMQRELEWSRNAVVALAAVIPPLTLQVLSLDCLRMQGACKEDLLLFCDTMARCHMLTHLSLRGMREFLTCAPPFLRIGVAGMRQLSSLDLGSSLSSDVEMQQLMDSLRVSIGGWHRLRMLSLSECSLSTWGLQLMHRDVAELPPGDVTNIEVLNLSSNGIDDGGAFVLGSFIMRCEMLRELHLRHNRITKKGVAAVFSSLISASSLACLNMHSNPLKDDGLEGMLRYAKFWPDLRRLDLTRCRLSARSLHTLCMALPFFDRLEDITLDRNDLRPLDATPADSKAVRPDGDVQLFAYDPGYMRGSPSSDWKVPTSFELDRRDALSGRVRFKGTETCTSAEEEEEEEEESRESPCALTPFGQFGSALSGCRELRRLSLSGCSLTDASFVALVTALMVRQLTYLDLSSNPLFSCMLSLENLDELLHRASASLQMLDLSCTGLGSVGVSLLADGNTLTTTSATSGVGRKGGESALRSLTALTQLRLSNCRMDPEGFEALADALPRVTLLERLFLDGNNTGGADAAVSLLGALDALPVLRFIGLYGSVPHDCRAAVMASREYLSLQRKGVVIHL